MMADQEVPEEIQDYYQTERRERAGVAWLLAFGTLVVTVLLAGGIFFGGRALYRRFTDDGQVAQNQPEEREQAAESANEPNSREQSQEQSRDNNQGRGNAVQGDETNDNNTNQNPAPNPTPTPTPTPTPATGDASGNLPGTGPSSTVYIFFAVSVLGYIIHRLYAKVS